MIFVLSEMCCHAEDVRKLRVLSHAQFSTHRMAPGWRGCRLGFDLSTTGRMMLFEQWASAMAFRRHLQSGRAISFANAIDRLLVRPATPRLVQPAGSDELDVVDTATTEFMIYQARCRDADTADARETLLAVDAMFRTCPGYLASHLAEDIFEPGCFFGVSEWREPRDAKAASVEPELLRLAVAAASLFRDPLRFRLLHTVAVEHLDIPRRSLAEHLADVFD